MTLDSGTLPIVIALLLLAAGALALAVALARARRGLAETTRELSSRLEAGGGQVQSRLDAVTTLVNQRLDSVTSQVNERLRETGESLERRMFETTGSLDRRLAENTSSLNERLSQAVHVAQQSSRAVGERLDSVGQVVGNVQASLGQLGEANRRILEVGQNIASLQEILQAPKLRGGLGELFLSEVLAQILTPEHFSLQHRFRSGETVDAVVRLGSGLVPIDSKFPLEAFRRLLRIPDEEDRRRERRQFVRDVKRHVDSIAKKYIQPDEGTFDFAFMYIPAENVYYEVILRDDDLGESSSLLEHALGRHVIPVSPTSFYAYLQSILLGLRGLRIEQRAREITAQLARLQGDFGKFEECFDLLGKHLKNAQNVFERTDGLRKKFEVRLEASAELGGAERVDELGPGAIPAPEPRGEAAAEEIPLFPEPEEQAGVPEGAED
jgi:DNA recombination protein RmuC